MLHTPSSRMAMMSSFTNDHLAAAVAAAAELARNGGTFMFHAPTNSRIHSGEVHPHQQLSPLSPALSSSSSYPPSNIHVNNDHGRDSPSSSLDHHDDNDDDEDEDEDADDDTEEGAERRIARSRERNREHARRTRLRKKAQLEALQSKVKGLQAEAEVLKQSLEECSLASILVNLSHKKSSTEDVTQSLISVATSSSDACNKDASGFVNLVVGSHSTKRKRFVSPEMLDKSASNQPLKLKINGKMTLIGGGGRSHINWKTGAYSDEQGVQKQLTQPQLESLRRERNRMHAKMTRDRKKNFVATIEKTIQDLESNNAHMKKVLARVVQTHFKGGTSGDSATTISSSSSSIASTARAALPYPVTPESTSRLAPSDEIPPLHHETMLMMPSKKKQKFRHGFALSSA